MTSSSVSVAMIVLNEAPRLKKLLPVLGWAKEIVIVDGGSADGSVEIARSFGARVTMQKFDDFASQRNRALEQVRGDWVLSLDADETPSAELIREIGSRINGERFDAYRIRIASKILGRRFRYSGTQDDCPIRLFRREKVRWMGTVHEVVKVVGKIGHMRSRLRHETIPNTGCFLEKMNRYTYLEAARRTELREKPSWDGGWYRAGREIFRRLIWKQGFLDGPEGWKFALLSGLSERELWKRHLKLWSETANKSCNYVTNQSDSIFSNLSTACQNLSLPKM